ncbi:MAG: phosphomethylpyrimidine synthase ThiC [Alphaproteobacteria bacterium]|nr:phosphomethylpyrimidine synthase ThiC [Alphaproteobacteria bacterium]
MTHCDIGNKLRNRPTIKCGDGHPTLLIGSVGTSQATDSLETEIAKTNRAVALGVHVVTDHSFYGDLAPYHKALVENVDAGISTVACYEFAARHGGKTGQDFCQEGGRLAIDLLREQAERGIDMITVHAPVLKRHLPMVARAERLIPTTSKGGGILARYMSRTGQENPYYVHYDEILDVFKTYNVTMSLGTAFRPASVCDTWDDLLTEELTVMGELVHRAQTAGVSVMIEGIGHATIGNIPKHVQLAKSLCYNAPYRVLPMATDIALGYDHISAAIATAAAVAAGANAILCVSRSEHIGLPSEADLEEAIITGKIAVHCGEISLPGADLSKDRQMSLTRWKKGCKGDWNAAVCPENAREALKKHGRLDDPCVQCSMCGIYCGIMAGNMTSKGR